MSTPLSLAEAKDLIRLCETGTLYEIEAWIRARRSLEAPTEIRKTPIGVAISTGFHSLVERLLRHEGRQPVKNGALALQLPWSMRASFPWVQVALPDLSVPGVMSLG
jgi:hypothetical protein